MNNEIELIIKILFPLLSIIISIYGLRSGWTYKKDKLFISRKNISEFSYQLYKNSGDVTFKKLAEDYGIAAFTKDKDLTKSQRMALLRTVEPVRDIDDYSKCQRLISIIGGKKIFTWSKKRYRYKIYRKTLKWFTTLIYLISSLLVALPFNYAIIGNARLINKINQLTLWQKLGLSGYLITVGVLICFICLDKVSKIKIAERLITSNWYK